MNSKKQWEILNKEKITDNTSPEQIINILLENRGYKTQKEKEAFLSTDLTEITTKSVAIDQKQLSIAIKRVEEALQKKETIVVFGDYDVDGITGVAILWESLHAISPEVIPYIPHRVDEGYGLSIKGIENILVSHPNTKVIITVDNGIVANDAVIFANEKGIDVIITDHHVPSETLPRAYTIVHTTQVCGAAVGYVFAQEILKNHKEITPRFLTDKGFDHLSLVALATVADLVPLTYANRTLLRSGLPLLQQTKRPGLLALFDEAKIEAGKIDVYTIGHVIAPRINAMGRLESGMDSLRMLCTNDKKRAEVLAQTLGKTNRERQLLTIATVEKAKQQVLSLKDKKKILFIFNESFEEGIIGLVAGRLVEEFYLPTIVVSKKEQVSKGSGRSIAGFNIIEAIRKTTDLLVNAGGHPMAAGFSVVTENISSLQLALEKIAEESLSDELLQRVLKIDMEISISLVSQSLFDYLKILSPFGIGNPEPVFVSKNVTVKDIFLLGRDKKHVKFLLSQENTQQIEAIAFGVGERFAEFKKGNLLNIAYTIDENEWMGRKKLQLKIKDINLPEETSLEHKL